MTNKLTNNIDKIACFEGINLPNEWTLTNLKQINFFIGPNNSGKSRKIRELFTSDINQWLIDTYSYPAIGVLEHAREIIEEKASVRRDIQNYVRYANIEKIKGTLDNLISTNPPIGIFQLADHIYRKSIGSIGDSSASKQLADILIEPYTSEYKKEISHVESFNNIDWSSTYIPTLRSLRNLDPKNDLLTTRTKTDYFRDVNKLGLIFTGHSLYQDLARHLLGTHEQRQMVRKYEQYLSEKFFFGQIISLVPMIEKDVVYFKEGDKTERPIYDLGDGIQSIIILTFPIFMADQPTIFFIEEPEHYLHAGLQRTLIETFAQHEEHMFFMTTHSNHLLDLAQERGDVAIQQVHQENGETVVTPTQEYGDLLDNLGVRASSVLLANCSIWVEGVTDKLYLRTYMKKYIQELRDNGHTKRANELNSYHENLHYVFAEYQGSNITHWAFGEETTDTQTPAKKLNKNILLIADADIDGKGNRTKDLKGALGDGFLLLKWKEIENYIPQNILVETAKARWGTFRQTDGCSIDRFANIKNNRFEKENEGIGRVLETYVTKAPGLERDFYKDKSGTIKDKVKFCHTAIKIMDEQDWKLTPELNTLCKRLWEHIEVHNS
ncbi:AAA family ATPase [Vibrio sp. OPT24]|uniref:AAA family ATPase n=1 Tax=Vibrio sp. OPT24 TaxID=2778643 RepID=UPI0018812B98|nr:ATP-binding protein [Vibrio sp. OPT24]MBE8557939.1 ATP-binding protein [Vibrio sp. OPT24]